MLIVNQIKLNLLILITKPLKALLTKIVIFLKLNIFSNFVTTSRKEKRNLPLNQGKINLKISQQPCSSSFHFLSSSSGFYTQEVREMVKVDPLNVSVT